MPSMHDHRKLRRIFAAAIAATLVLLLLAGGRPTEDAHAASVCTRHSKWVFTYVIRHRKRVRVPRLKHWWTCAEVVEPAASTPPASTPPAAAPSQPRYEPEPEPEANAIGVVARDANKHFSFEPTRTLVKSGTLTMQLINEGEDPHSMAIQRIGPGETPEGPVTEIPATASKQQRTGSVEVQPGRYRMWCTLFHHAEEGMEFDLTVE